MRVRERPDFDENGKPLGPGTRADRAANHAAARIKNRHAERDWLGRVIEEPKPFDGMTEAQVQRAKAGATRLDAYLVDMGLAASRDKAKALISAGRVAVDGTTDRVKPSTPIAPGQKVTVTGDAGVLPGATAPSQGAGVPPEESA